MRTKNPAAVSLGRRGGKAGTGKAKARTSAQARKAARERWRKWRKRQQADLTGDEIRRSKPRDV